MFIRKSPGKKAEREAADGAKREKLEHEATEKAVREKVEYEAAEKAKRKTAKSIVVRNTNTDETHKPASNTLQYKRNTSLVMTVSLITILVIGLIIVLSQFVNPISVPTATATITKAKTLTATFTILPPSRTSRPSFTPTFTLSPTSNSNANSDSYLNFRCHIL